MLCCCNEQLMFNVQQVQVTMQGTSLLTATRDQNHLKFNTSPLKHYQHHGVEVIIGLERK